MGRELLPAPAVELLLREGGIEDDVGEQVQRGVEVLLQGGHPDRRRVQVRACGQGGAETLERLGDRRRRPRRGALVKHVHGHPGGAGQRELIGGVAGVEHEVEVDHGYRVPPGEDDVEAVRETRRLARRKRGRRKIGDLRRPRRAVDGALGHGVGGEGLHLDGERPPAQPFDGGGPDIGGGGAHNRFLRPPVAVGAAEVNFAGREDVRLAAEAPDALDAADEGGPPAGPGPCELGRGRARFEERAQLLVEDRLHRGEVLPRLGRRLQDEQAAELAREDERRHVGRDLVLVDQPPVEARTAAGGEDVAGERQVVEGGVLQRRDVPRLVDPRLRHPVLEHDTALLGPPGEVDIRLDERRSPRGMWPKWRSTRARTSSGSTSPATTSTALAAPYQVSNHVRTSSSEAAFRSSIEPMVEWP